MTLTCHHCDAALAGPYPLFGERRYGNADTGALRCHVNGHHVPALPWWRRRLVVALARIQRRHFT